MESIILKLQRIINHLPGPGKLMFGALVADRNALRVLIACLVAIIGTYLQPPVLTLYTPGVQAGLRDPGSGAPLLVAAGYLLLAVLTLVGGASGDIFGRKRFLMVGLIGVLVSDLAGMVLINSPDYFVANTANTIFSVLVMPMTIAIVTLAFPIQVRPFAYGAIFAVQGISLVLSSTINAIFVSLSLQWLAFIPAIALCIVAMRLVRRDVSESRAPPGTSRMELVLNVVWASAIFTLVYGLLAIGGGLTNLNLFLIIAICVIGFVIAYRWVQRRMGSTVIKLYDVRDLSLAIFAGIMLSVAQASFFYQIGTFFQKIQGVGPLVSGLRMLPFILAMMIATLVIVRLSIRFGARRLISGGLLVMGIGLGMMIILSTTTPYWMLIVPLVIMGFGFGIAGPARTVVVLTVPPPTLVGMASGVNSAAGQSGFALGTILSSWLLTVFATQSFDSQLNAAAQASPEAIEKAANLFQETFSKVISGDLPNLTAELSAALLVPFNDAFSSALGQTYLVIGLLMAATAVVIFFGMNKGLRASFITPPGVTNQVSAAPTAPATSEPAQ